MWQIIKLVQAFMGLLVTCNNEDDPFKNEGARMVTKDLLFCLFDLILYVPTTIFQL